MIAHNPERNTGLLDGGHEVKERTRRKVSLAFVEIRHRAAIDAAASVRQLSLRMPGLCLADRAAPAPRPRRATITFRPRSRHSRLLKISSWTQ